MEKKRRGPVSFIDRGYAHLSAQPMGLGTKNRQKQTADICKQQLRESVLPSHGVLVESDV